MPFQAKIKPSKKKDHLPVDMPGNRILGNLPQFRHDSVGMAVQAAQLGRVVRLRFINLYTYFLREPEDIKWVLVDNHRNYHKGRGTQALRPVLGQGLLTSEDELHRRQRQMVQPAFHRQRIAGYAQIISRFAGAHLTQWQDGQTLDLHEELMRLTMMIIAQSLFDVDVSQRASRLGQAISDLIHDFNFTRIGPIGQFIDRFDIARARRRNERLAVLDELMYGMIRTRRGEGVDHGDLLSMLLEAQDVDATGSPDPAMSDQQIRDELLTLFIAGHETTAIAITWTFYLLSQHPEIEQRLLAELTAVLGDPHGDNVRLPAWEDLPKLEYTRRIFAESMRLYPPVWATARLALHDDEIAGYRIPAGSGVMVSPYVTHHDARFWPDPERFDPDRFAPEMEATRPKFAYFPFGAGPRRCIGEPFAWMEGQLLVAAIAHRYQLEVKAGYVAELLPRITLRPKNGLPATVHRR